MAFWRWADSDLCFFQVLIPGLTPITLLESEAGLDVATQLNSQTPQGKTTIIASIVYKSHEASIVFRILDHHHQKPKSLAMRCVWRCPLLSWGLKLSNSETTDMKVEPGGSTWTTLKGPSQSLLREIDTSHTTTLISLKWALFTAS